MGGGSFAPPGKARSPKSGNGRAPRAPPTSFDAALSPAAPAVRPGARRDGANERCPARRFLHAGRGLRFEEPARRPGPARRSRLATRQRICSPVRVFSSAPRNGRRALTAMDGVRGYPAVPVLSRDGCGAALRRGALHRGTAPHGRGGAGHAGRSAQSHRNGMARCGLPCAPATSGLPLCARTPFRRDRQGGAVIEVRRRGGARAARRPPLPGSLPSAFARPSPSAGTRLPRARRSLRPGAARDFRDAQGLRELAGRAGGRGRRFHRQARRSRQDRPAEGRATVGGSRPARTCPAAPRLPRAKACPTGRGMRSPPRSRVTRPGWPTGLPKSRPTSRGSTAGTVAHPDPGRRRRTLASILRCSGLKLNGLRRSEDAGSVDRFGAGSGSCGDPVSPGIPSVPARGTADRHRSPDDAP